LIAKTALRIGIGVALLATAAAVALVALAYALYAGLSPLVGPAWASAAVAGAAALVLLIGGLVFIRKPGGGKRPVQDEGLAAKLIALGRERPLVAAAFAIAAGVIAVRSPGLLTALISAVIARETAGPKR
jgi:hypothetical protein